MVPYLANVTADYVKDTDTGEAFAGKTGILLQSRWQQTIERLIADGCDEFVEIGPGHTLSGFMKKIGRNVKTCNIDKMEDFKAYVEQ